MVIIIEDPFVTTLIHIVVNMRSGPHILRETQLVSVHTKMPKEVDMIFARHPLDPRRGSLDPLGPPRPPRPLGYFGLPMMNSSRPPLTPNKPYR